MQGHDSMWDFMWNESHYHQRNFQCSTTVVCVLEALLLFLLPLVYLTEVPKTLKIMSDSANLFLHFVKRKNFIWWRKNDMSKQRFMLFMYTNSKRFKGFYQVIRYEKLYWVKISVWKSWSGILFQEINWVIERKSFLA